jgi:hypothetical protein
MSRLVDPLTKAQAAERTINTARSRFKHPRSIRNNNCRDEGYCVGGAFGRYTLGILGNIRGLIFGYKDVSIYHYPSRGALTEVMCEYNKELPGLVAMRFAEKIIGFNDQEDFNAAWEQLRLALSYPDVIPIEEEESNSAELETTDDHPKVVSGAGV